MYIADEENNDQKAVEAQVAGIAKVLEGSDTLDGCSIEEIESGTRPHIYHIEAEDRTYIVKNVQSTDEKEAIQAADPYAPDQLLEEDDFIVEEYVSGTPVTGIEDERDAYALGQQIGEFLGRLHSEDLVYNDVLFGQNVSQQNAFMRSRRENEDGRELQIAVIDFGSAVSVANHPHYTDDQIAAFLSTMGDIIPFGREQYEEALAETREEVESMPQNHLKLRDIRLIGKSFDRSEQLSADAKAAIDRGFADAYGAPSGQMYGGAREAE